MKPARQKVERHRQSEAEVRATPGFSRRQLIRMGAWTYEDEKEWQARHDGLRPYKSWKGGKK